MDGTDPNSDLEFQTSTTEISAHFSIGTFCPIIYARWSIEDASGTVTQDYNDVNIPSHNPPEINNEFSLYTDQVRLYNEESYRVLVQAMDITGETYSLRSNGLTVTTDDLVPNIVQDGPIPDEDLNYQEPVNYLSAHWGGFGDGTPQQEIVYYEVAAGSNTGYPNTRTDIAPFTNIGLNTSHTFPDLNLLSDIVYYTTVRATAVSGATIDSTSNGIQVGHTHSIQPGDIVLTPFSSNTNEISVHWEEFSSNVPIRSYEWAVGEVNFSPAQLQHMCDDYLSDFNDTFEILPFTSVGLSTASFLSGLNLTDNTTYYVSIRATDEANKCLTVTSSGMLVDLSEPLSPPQGIFTGPVESLIGLDGNVIHLVFIRSQEDLKVWWEEFTDPESGVSHYEVSLFEQTECGSNENLNTVPSCPGYIDTGLERSFVFDSPSLRDGVAYVVEVRATNFAGGSASAYSEPIVLDMFEVLPGEIKDGLEWEGDVVFQSDLSMLSGVFSHAKLPAQYPGVVLQNDPCPTTVFYSLTTDHESWSDLVPTVVGIDSSIVYDSLQTNISIEGLRIVAEYKETGEIFSGAYHTNVDMSRGGVVSLDIQAALGSDGEDAELEGQSVTSVVFVDSLSSDILADFEYEVRESDHPFPPSVSAVGLQIHHRYDDDNDDVEQKIVLWTSNPLSQLTYVTRDVPNLDLSSVHTYTFDFQEERTDVDSEHWIDLYIDRELVATIHGVTELSNNTRLILHVFNRNGFIPTVQDPFNLPTVEAVFANVSLPLQRSHICDSGRPFYSPSSPIVQFSVGVGSSPGLSDIRDLEVRISVPNFTCTEITDSIHSTLFRQYRYVGQGILTYDIMGTVAVHSSSDM